MKHQDFYLNQESCNQQITYNIKRSYLVHKAATSAGLEEANSQTQTHNILLIKLWIKSNNNEDYLITRQAIRWYSYQDDPALLQYVMDQSRS